jgi:hypothetical protein
MRMSLAFCEINANDLWNNFAAFFYENKITEDELDDMFPATVTWALRTLKK